MKFFENFAKTQKFSCASTGYVELCFTSAETRGRVFQAPVTQPVGAFEASPAQSESLRPTSSILACVVLDEDKYCVHL